MPKPLSLRIINRKAENMRESVRKPIDVHRSLAIALTWLAERKPHLHGCCLLVDRKVRKQLSTVHTKIVLILQSSLSIKLKLL
jgi:hypothetical protein